MGIRKKQQGTTDTTSPAKPACIQHADTIRRKARHYTNLTEQTGKQCDDRHRAIQQRQQAEKEMAELRAEAIQARRLATQIENLHQPVQHRRKGRIMSTTISDPGQAQRMSRRDSDNSHSGGGQLSFNPLHPSMELPPEQLIRLLGLENKTKRRKKRPASRTALSGKLKPTGMLADTPVRLTPVTPPASAEREKDMASLPFEEPQRNLMVAALVAGAIAGIGLSIYLFWGNPDEVKATAAHNPPLQIPATSKVQTATVAPPAAPVAAPGVSMTQGTVDRGNSIPQTADTEAEQARLRGEAEKRFAERMQQDVRRDQETMPIEPDPATAVAPAEAATAPETFVEEQPLKIEQKPLTTPLTPPVDQAADRVYTPEPEYQEPLENENTAVETGGGVEDEATTEESENTGEALF